MSLDVFHPLIRQWFQERFNEPTEPQRLGWPHIAADKHTLIAAPTGSGKTLAAFLVFIDRLFRQWLDGNLPDEMQVVYVSPLKALSNDIECNLRGPLAEIRQIAEQAGLDSPPIRVAVRTGDTSSSDRQKMLRRPPHLLVTTPESLYLLLTAEKGRERLRTVRTVIVDEIHALARDKRGSHLSLSLERLAAACETPPVRVGLSATQRPIDQIARFLVGSGKKECEIVDAGHVRSLDLALDVPPSELAAVCSLEQWSEVYQRLMELINSHRSTLIFVNTRRLAERVAHHLTEMLGEQAVASHHGSLSRQIRLSAEQRLKSGELKAIVATASLEMGIDIGYIDLVCQIGSPRSIATFLQRVGRSGHSLGALPKGRLFPLTRDELLECMALVRAVRRGDLDRIEIPEKPLDILAQQIIAEVACQEWDEQDLLELCRGAWPFRDLTAEEFETVVNMSSEGVAPGSRRGAYLHRDRINGRLRARRAARLAAITSGGAIPETAEYRVVTESEKTFVGTVDEDFAIESLPGDVFLLGNTSWRIRFVRGGEVVVKDAEGAPPTIPFWFGEAPGRTVELSGEVSQLRKEISDQNWEGKVPSARRGSLDPAVAADRRSPHAADDPERTDNGDLRSGECHSQETETQRKTETQRRRESARQHVTSNNLDWLRDECGADEWPAEQAIRYVAAQKAAIGLIPTKNEIVFERFFDESGGMQLVIHSPLGARINRAWGLALRKRFCRSFDFELQAAADDNGIVLSIGPQHSFPIDRLFKMLRTDNGRDLLEQALLAAPMFQVRWRWNVTRSLAVLRRDGGKKVPPYLQRMRSDDLLAASFPETVGCLENHHGDVTIPDHPLVQQTMHDCLHEAMDLDRWLAVLADVEAGRVKLIARDTREPSPFSHELLNANPYAFLDDAPLEERRSRAVATRRTLSIEAFQDLAKLDPEAISQVRQQAWPLVRNADELHDALMSLVVVREDEAAAWSEWFAELVVDGRAARVTLKDSGFWIASERWPVIESVYDEANCQPPLTLPAELCKPCSRSDGWVELVRGRIQHCGPVSAGQLVETLMLDVEHVRSSLEALEGEGVLLRGQFTDEVRRQSSNGDDKETEWCDRRLLARIHRLTLDGLRRQIEPVEPADFMRFLIKHQHLDSDHLWGGPVGVREVIAQLQGFQLPAGAWENRVLRVRVGDYDPQWLDNLFLSGELMWGRLRPPRRLKNGRHSMAVLTRTVPMSLLLREDLPWLLPDLSKVQTADSESERSAIVKLARSNAVDVLEALEARGALFFQQLKSQTNLLPSHLEEALRELAALGLITCDAFAAVRAIVSGNRKTGLRRRRRTRTKLQSSSTPIGRWSHFPGQVEPAERGQYLERWCHQLLRRYGVVFRDLLTRESVAPRWFELVPTLRRLELRGKIRGGRFISGVAGEQFATDDAVRKLREVRDSESNGQWIVISAADPLNLIGIVTDEPRIPATYKNSIILRDGRLVAAKEAGQIEFFADMSLEDQAEMRRALNTGRRPIQRESQQQAMLSFHE